MKTLTKLLLLVVLTLGNASSFAATPAGSPVTPEEAMVDGEVRKIDMDTRKITIKHGVIKNLDMPGMTMVFQVRDPGMLDKVKAGDKVRFSAEKSGGAFVVTDIQVAR